MFGCRECEIIEDLRDHGGIEFKVPATGGNITYDNIIIGDRMGYNSCEEVLYFGYGTTGDLNNDCRVDFKDITMFTGEWLYRNDPANPQCQN